MSLTRHRCLRGLENGIKTMVEKVGEGEITPQE